MMTSLDGLKVESIAVRKTGKGGNQVPFSISLISAFKTAPRSFDLLIFHIFHIYYLYNTPLLYSFAHLHLMILYKA